MTHDPTTLNQQGADKGNQYRSIILYADDDEKIVAEKVIKNLQHFYSMPIVTELAQFTAFYEAEEDHQNYYAENPEAFYCEMVIAPKLAKYKESKDGYLLSSNDVD